MSGVAISNTPYILVHDGGPVSARFCLATCTLRGWLSAVVSLTGAISMIVIMQTATPSFHAAVPRYDALSERLDNPFPPSVFIVSPDNVDAASEFLQTSEATNSGANCAGQFSNNRYALFFLPGEYELDVRVPFYMQVAGLGREAADVSFVGPRGVHALNCGPEPPAPHVGKPYADVGALDNFWRSAEPNNELL